MDASEALSIGYRASWSGSGDPSSEVSEQRRSVGTALHAQTLGTLVDLEVV
jgi:hypothetical protein